MGDSILKKPKSPEKKIKKSKKVGKAETTKALLAKMRERQTTDGNNEEK